MVGNESQSILVYLDVSCLNRPFDDQTQVRVRLEAEAVLLILERVDRGEWQQATSDMATLKTDAMTDEERRRRVRALLQDPEVFVKLTEGIFQRAGEVEGLGIKPADAVHVAAAEAANADLLFTCDDRFPRAATRHADKLRVRVANPLDWMKEVSDAGDLG